MPHGERKVARSAKDRPRSVLGSTSERGVRDGEATVVGRVHRKVATTERSPPPVDTLELIDDVGHLVKGVHPGVRHDAQRHEPGDPDADRLLTGSGSRFHRRERVELTDRIATEREHPLTNVMYQPSVIRIDPCFDSVEQHQHLGNHRRPVGDLDRRRQRGKTVDRGSELAPLDGPVSADQQV